jgi:hypothetical protein
MLFWPKKSVPDKGCKHGNINFLLQKWDWQTFIFLIIARSPSKDMNEIN